MKLEQFDDGQWRCRWGTMPPDYIEYHDEEWGRPVVDDTRLFEKVCLEGFQAGLSWLTILRKREHFRAAFAGFNIDAVARFRERDVERLLKDAGIIRHRGKIEATINNARCAQQLIQEFGGLAPFFWEFATTRALEGTDVPAITDASTALSRELRSRGWKFVGPTTMYALMQAMGVVNDHLDGCIAKKGCERERQQVMFPK